MLDSNSSIDSPSEGNTNSTKTPLTTINNNPSRLNNNRTRNKTNEYFSQLKYAIANKNIIHTETYGLEALHKEIYQYKNSFFASPYEPQLNKS